jgi:hypothetical protein
VISTLIGETYRTSLPRESACGRPTEGRTNRVGGLVPAVKSLAALGRYEAALDVAEKDFGPMIDAQRAKLMTSQLLALVLILHQLQRHERINELAGIVYACTHTVLGVGPEVRTNLANIIGDDKAFAALPTPDPADLTTDRCSDTYPVGRGLRESVGDVKPGGDLGWVEPNDKFARYTVALSVLFCPVGPHVAAADQRSEASHLVAVVG